MKLTLLVPGAVLRALIGGFLCAYFAFSVNGRARRRQQTFRSMACTTRSKAEYLRRAPTVERHPGEF